MSQDANFFADFQPVNKVQWFERIAKDLKGKPLADLFWHLNKEITVDPFMHADDQSAPPIPLGGAAASWEINENIDASTSKEANRQALEALAYGAESVHFTLNEPVVASELSVLLDRVYLDYIGLQFSGIGVEQAPASVLSTLGNLAKEGDILPQNLKGSLFFDPAMEPGQIKDWRYLVDLVEYARAEFPGFHCITVDGRDEFDGAQAVTDELTAVLQRASLYLQEFSARGLDINQVAACMQFSLNIGKSYFVEIAKLRAFKLLWINMLKAWGAKAAYPHLDIQFAEESYSDELYSNMIAATTMAMSAVLGGASRLTVRPYDAGREEQAKYPQAFARRIARNVQHLLKQESGFAAVSDPAAGSYYIEKLTTQVAETVWKNLDKN